jgi:oligoribonuclease (3'-5' exoribonuclease)
MALLWLDLETTGLSAVNDAILEVAWTLTDAELRPMIDGEVRTGLVDLGPIEFKLLTGAPQVVFEMHAKSGLTKDLSNPLLNHYSLEEIASDIVNELHVNVPEGEAIYLAGASVHFDLGFLRSQMPELAVHLSHRVYDTSTLKAFFESIGVEHGVVNENQHRAKDDVIETLAVARRYREWAQTMQRSVYAMTGEVIG